MMEVRDKRLSMVVSVVSVVSSKLKLKCQSAKVQKEILNLSPFKGQNASWVVKMRVERSKRELNGQHVRWTV